MDFLSVISLNSLNIFWITCQTSQNGLAQKVTLSDLLAEYSISSVFNIVDSSELKITLLAKVSQLLESFIFSGYGNCTKKALQYFLNDYLLYVLFLHIEAYSLTQYLQKELWHEVVIISVYIVNILVS